MPSARLREAAHEPLEQVLPHQRRGPQGGVGEACQHRVEIPLAVGLDGPPEHERLKRVVEIAGMRGERRHDRQALRRGQPPCGGGELDPRLDVGLRGGERAQARGHGVGHAGPIGQEPHAPEAHVGIGMIERMQRERLVETAAEVDRPEGLERGLPRVLVEHRPQQRQHRSIASVTEEPQRHLAMPAVAVLEQARERGPRHRAVVEPLRLRGVDAPQPPDAPRVGRDAPLMVARVIDPLLVEVGDVDRAVRSALDLDGTEPGVAALEDEARIRGAERRAPRPDVGGDHVALQRRDREEASRVAPRQRVPLVDHEGVREAGDRRVLDVLEEPEGERVR